MIKGCLLKGFNGLRFARPKCPHPMKSQSNILQKLIPISCAEIFMNFCRQILMKKNRDLTNHIKIKPSDIPALKWICDCLTDILLSDKELTEMIAYIPSYRYSGHFQEFVGTSYRECSILIYKVGTSISGIFFRF